MRPTMYKNCYACKSEDVFTDEYVESWGHKTFSGLTIDICNKCGFGSVSDEPDFIDIDKYYNEVYRSQDCEMYINFQNMIPSQLDMRSHGQFLLARNYVSSLDTLNILDVGPGPGNSFFAAKNIFPNSNIFFLEKNRNVISLYKKYYDVKIIDDISNSNQKFDVILLSHSLEHFNKAGIDELLITLQSSLTDTGIVVIEVPNNDFRTRIHREGVERVNDTPHLQFFSIESLNQIFITNGYEISFINSTGRLINTATPNNISEIRKSWRDKHLNTKFGVGENSIRSILKRSVKIILNKVGLKKHLHFFNEFVLKNGLCNDEFMYGGNRHAIRIIIKKQST